MHYHDTEALALGPEGHLYTLERNSPTPLYKSNNSTITSLPDNLQNNRAITYNYPNPFSESTQIFYSLGQESMVQLNIYNCSGQLINSINEGAKTKGNHCANFDARGLKNGTYFYSVTVNGKTTDSKKMSIVR